MFSEATIKNRGHKGAVLFIGAPGEIRTPDRSVRSRVLYPAELRAHCLVSRGKRAPAKGDPRRGEHHTGLARQGKALAGFRIHLVR